VARGRKPRTNTTEGAAPKQASALEATPWASGDKLRGNMDAAEYKHVALGLIYLGPVRGAEDRNPG
jgi:type I restriction enzyme M protein